MDNQESLINFDRNFKFENIKILRNTKNSLENEKNNVIKLMSGFIDSIDFDKRQYNGRPKYYFNDILKSLIVISYNGMSYRRSHSDLVKLEEEKIIKNIPKRSTLCKYMGLKKTKRVVEKLIELTALFFREIENTIMVDSTWLSTRMYSGGFKKVHNKKYTNFSETRKLHIACLKESRIIACARTSEGQKHDSPFFKELISTVVRNGFKISSVLGDKGYCSRDNYNLCYNFNIEDVFLDFKSNAIKRSIGSPAWKKQVTLFKENPEDWYENYRFRVLVEGVFSALKRKHLNYLRMKKGSSQDVELLLKALCYNFEIICKHY